MKKLLWATVGALVAVGIWGLYRSRRCCKNHVRGTVVAVNPENKTFELRCDNQTVTVFHVMPETGFYWLADTTESPQRAVFSDLLSGTPISVFFCQKEPVKAQKVVLEKVK